MSQHLSLGGGDHCFLRPERLRLDQYFSRNREGNQVFYDTSRAWNGMGEGRCFGGSGVRRRDATVNDCLEITVNITLIG
jgi:hypothetical protein